jgi:nucleotide-binding universal stress UspA family protein
VNAALQEMPAPRFSLHLAAFCTTIDSTLRLVAGKIRKIAATAGCWMFTRILHANDGSGHAFNALRLALRIAKKDAAELHMVSVEERGHMPELTEEIRGGTGANTVRFDKALLRARALAEDSHVDLRTHVLTGHPVHNVIKLATDLNADLIVVGASGHSALYDRMIGSRAQKILHHATCPVLVVK